MKGLLIKDFCLTFKNRKLIGILLFMIIFVFLIQEGNTGEFIISFVTMLGGTLVLSTISTDEFDKSSMFLMTMPIKRSTYALEKYVFSFGCSFIGWVSTTILICIMNPAEALQTLGGAIVVLGVITLFQMLMIPVQLKYGGENGRMVLMGAVIAIMGIAFVSSKLLKVMFNKEELQVWFQGVLSFINDMSPVMVIPVVLIGWSLCLVISARISIRTIEKREY
ncbi:MAG: ABC-2 transporter permease [Lachnospiraceae bacterium]|nr:ABC-2 transporter permease [Lachnospiraceae bacterium]MBQ6995283.1 ABC-2 transporter permease [Lachnospiraceae bacterium]